MINSTSWQPDAFYLACQQGHLKKARETAEYNSLNQVDTDGNTPLHIVSSKGYIELIQLLFRYHADRRVKNKAGLTAEQMAKDDEIKNLFKNQIRPKTDEKHFVATRSDVEWLDNYKNAYRIAYENREHMRRWLLKVPLRKLLEELITGYIDKMEFAKLESREKIKDYMKAVIEWDNLSGLVFAYTDGGTCFCTKLNYDLAEIGSNFRFLSTQNLFNSGYLDNEAPKGLGQHIFAAILIDHPFFQEFYHTGSTYRGMNIKPDELAEYKIGDIVLTRSFLSTSKNENVVELFKQGNENKEQPLDAEGKQPVVCVYKVINPRSSLAIETISMFPDEKEVLIVPFAVFRVVKIEPPNNSKNGDSSPPIIYLEECDSNVL